MYELIQCCNVLSKNVLIMQNIIITRLRIKAY